MSPASSSTRTHHSASGKWGVCAGGHPLTVDAGRRAFEAGGNAIDAAVAAQLMATVAEPLLTGLGGGGIALLRHEGQTRILDFFSDRPGLGADRPLASLEHTEVSFGVDVQRFSYGVASVAVPGMIKGLWELHRSGGRLPLPKLARWAADQAERGLEVSSGLSKSIAALAPIIQHDDYLNKRLLVRDAGGAFQPATAGHPYHLAELSETLMRWAEGGPDAIFNGPPRDMILDALGPFAPLGLPDLERYEVRWLDPLERRLALPNDREARIFTPGLPSQGGVQIAALIERVAARLSHHAQTSSGKRLDPLGAEVVTMIAREMRALEQTKDERWPLPLTEDAVDPFWRNQLGFTTHISVCDAQGTSVGITSSLGETAGFSVGQLGLLLNNFMGEEDVAPPGCMPPVGSRLYTMCSPTLLEYEHDVGLQQTVLGSGGSSRIRSVVAQGALYASEALLGLGDDYTRIAEAPRIHYEDGKLRLETFERPTGVIEAARELCDAWGDELVCFDDWNLFFGGLHIASCGALGLRGAGDPRRSGSVSYA